MPPPLSGNKVSKVSSLKIPAIFAQKSDSVEKPKTVVKKITPLMGNKFVTKNETEVNSTKKNNDETKMGNGLSKKSKEQNNNEISKNSSDLVNGVSDCQNISTPKHNLENGINKSECVETKIERKYSIHEKVVESKKSLEDTKDNLKTTLKNIQVDYTKDDEIKSKSSSQLNGLPTEGKTSLQSKSITTTVNGIQDKSKQNGIQKVEESMKNSGDKTKSTSSIENNLKSEVKQLNDSNSILESKTTPKDINTAILNGSNKIETSSLTSVSTTKRSSKGEIKSTIESNLEIKQLNGTSSKIQNETSLETVSKNINKTVLNGSDKIEKSSLTSVSTTKTTSKGEIKSTIDSNLEIKQINGTSSNIQSETSLEAVSKGKILTSNKTKDNLETIEKNTTEPVQNGVEINTTVNNLKSEIKTFNGSVSKLENNNGLTSKTDIKDKKSTSAMNGISSSSKIASKENGIQNVETSKTTSKSISSTKRGSKENIKSAQLNGSISKVENTTTVEEKKSTTATLNGNTLSQNLASKENDKQKIQESSPVSNTKTDSKEEVMLSFETKKLKESVNYTIETKSATEINPISGVSPKSQSSFSSKRNSKEEIKTLEKSSNFEAKEINGSTVKSETSIEQLKSTSTVNGTTRQNLISKENGIQTIIESKSTKRSSKEDIKSPEIKSNIEKNESNGSSLELTKRKNSTTTVNGTQKLEESITIGICESKITERKIKTNKISEENISKLNENSSDNKENANLVSSKTHRIGENISETSVSSKLLNGKNCANKENLNKTTCDNLLESDNKLKSKSISPIKESSTTRIKKIKIRQGSVDSNYGSSSTLQTSPSLSSLSSNDTLTTSNYESPSTLTSSIYDTAKSHLTANYQLPPVVPVARKSRPIKKAFTAPLQNLPESTQKIAAVLQTRPLRSGCTSPIPRIKSPQSHDERVTTGRLVISRSPSPSISNSRASSISRSCSPSLSRMSRSQSLTYSRNSNSSPTPRRIFPQEPTKINLDDLRQKEPSPVIFDANLSFVIGCKTQMRQNVKTTAAHMDATTASNYLSTKISEFLNRTDHVMDEWKNLGHRGNDDDSFPKSEEQRRILGRSKSAANIAIKGYTLFSKDRSNSIGKSNSLARSRSNSTVRDFMTDDVFSECDELSEMTADLAEEHSTATLAAERLDAETSERIRLERELSEVQNKNKTLQQTSERLEMELLYARSDINGVISEEDEEGEGDTSVYKAKYERAVRELEFTRRRLQQQHEDDLEQLVGLKKQLEKKLSDAYEEVEEQRQVVGQWKRKVQKLTSEMNDLRLLIEEQNARNNLLEKKQRKFDSETQLLQDEVRQEKQQKDRLSREKDILLAEKYTLESNLADVRLELELKEERLNSLQQEYNDITFGGKSEDEVTTLRKQKQDAERRVHEQEEELDDLAGQVQMLEQAKVRLEMSLEQQRKESRREAQQRDDELEEVRCNAQKKVKALEAQLENEHEERTLLLREKHSLERRLAETAEAGRTERQGDEALLQRLKRDLRRTKALLRDAQTMLERNKADNPGKAVIRQLRNQLDDIECARAAAVKAKQTLEGELSDVQSQLDDAHRQKAEAEERANIANRERTDLRTQLEENEEELAEVLKKYRATVQQLSTEQMALQEQISINSDIEAERNSLKEQLAELTMKLEAMETLGDPSSSAQAKRMELRAKELESKLEFEQTTRARLEVQITRLKEATDKLQTDLAHARTKEAQAQDNLRKLQRSLRELREEHTALATRENESLQKRKELEKKLESSEAETVAARADLRLALQRIDDLQAAIQGELEDTTSDHSDSDNDSYSSDESIDTFLANHKLSPTKPDRSSLHLDTSPRSNEKRLRVGTPEDSFA